MHGTSAEQVEVKVVDGLAAVGAGVDDQAIPIAKASVCGNLRGRGKKLAKHGGVLGDSLFG